jgi:hypothetical protein
MFKKFTSVFKHIAKKKLAKKTLFLCFFFFQHSFAEKHVIGSHNAGFFSDFLGILNHLYWCEKTVKTPVVYWGKENYYWQANGYNGSLNAWEYYFEPVSDETASVDEPRDKRYSVDGWTFYYHQIDLEKRLLANRLINNYIKINPAVVKKVSSFFTKNMFNKKTIGIHLRGTDKDREVKSIDPLVLLERANKEAELLGNCQFLVATDEYRLLAIAEKTLRRPIIYYPCLRSENNIPLHVPMVSPIKNKAVLGEDVLIEALLLAQCDLFLHTYSNVSAAVLYFNATLKNILFTQKSIS